MIEALLQSDTLKRLSSEWLAEITGTYMDLLADSLIDGTSADDVKAVTGDVKHAELIAKTEVNRGENAALFEAFKAKNVQYVIWVTTSANPCPECLENEAAGPWPLGQPFPSGVVMPPDHPQCECHLEPA